MSNSTVNIILIIIGIVQILATFISTIFQRNYDVTMKFASNAFQLFKALIILLFPVYLFIDGCFNRSLSLNMALLQVGAGSIILGYFASYFMLSFKDEILLKRIKKLEEAIQTLNSKRFNDIPSSR